MTELEHKILFEKGELKKSFYLRFRGYKATLKISLKNNTISCVTTDLQTNKVICTRRHNLGSVKGLIDDWDINNNLIRKTISHDRIRVRQHL